jgi:hypothetical protein
MGRIVSKDSSGWQTCPTGEALRGMVPILWRRCETGWPAASRREAFSSLVDILKPGKLVRMDHESAHVVLIDGFEGPIKRNLNVMAPLSVLAG